MNPVELVAETVRVARVVFFLAVLPLLALALWGFGPGVAVYAAAVMWGEK